MQNFDFDMDSKPVVAAKAESNEIAPETTAANQEETDSNKRKDFKKPVKNTKRTKKSNENSNSSGSESECEDESLKNGLVSTIFAAKAINIQPGHTGFLTFATLLHKDFLEV